MTSPTTIILILLLLEVKHFMADFLYQPAWQYKNKGKLGHYGGIAHSGQHALGSFIVLSFFVPFAFAGYIVAAEFLIHYAIDWSKTNAEKKFALGPTDDAFWRLLGFDQLLHQLTYVGILFCLTLH